MTESQFQSKFSRWLKYRFQKTAAFELKICKEKSMPFCAVEDHQVYNLLLVKHGQLVYKIDDSTVGQKPFDCFSLFNTEAYVVVQFWKPRVNHFYMIDVDRFVQEKELSERKSLTEERANIIGIKQELR